MENKVFLGGTCNESTWREKLIPMLKINYFNPIVPDWTEECQKEEERQKEICRYHLYVITPRMTGCFSIAEVIDSSNKFPDNTILCILDRDGAYGFDKPMEKSLRAVENMAHKNGAHCFKSIEEVANFLNNK